MRNLFYALTASIIALSLMMSCGSKKTGTDQVPAPKKVLVAYFSATGTTKGIAEEIAKNTDGDLYEITPARPYTAADLDWTDSTSRSSREMHNPDFRPEITDSLPDMAGYDVVFLGFPIWWGVAPTAVNTFIEKTDLSGKPVVVFATSGGSPVKPAVDSLRARYPNINWSDDAKIINNASDAGIDKWKERFGL